MSKKKVYDILPPKVANKVEDTIKSLGNSGKIQVRKKAVKKDQVKNQVKEPKTVFKQEEPKRRVPLREILIGGGVIVLLFAVYLYNKLPKADIEIWPKLETLTLEEQVIADKSFDTIDLYQRIIPAQYVEEEIDSWQEVESTGTASNEGKASGNIRIYNKIEPVSPLTLIKGTHFLSDSGKYFITLDKITIPAATYQKGKIVPGSIEVKVQAKETGEDFNIKPAKFSVPKLSGTAYYYVIWAESENPMSGGYKGNVKKVTKDDIEKAKDDLTKKLLVQAETSLKGKLSSSNILLDSAILRDVIDASSTVKEGAIIEKFNVQAKVKVSGIIFKKDNLEQIVKNDITSRLPDSKDFLEESLKIDYNPELLDIKGGKTKLNVKSSVNTYQTIDTEDLIDLFSKKSSSEIEGIINARYKDEVSGLKINFWPFWVNKAPKDKNRIKINLNFE